LDASAALESPAPLVAPHEAATVRGSGSTNAPRTPDWHALASRGKYTEALAAVERAGFTEACQRESGEELLNLGDVARLAGNGPRARDAYRAARAKLIAGGRSAYGLGLTAFECDRDFRAAARWFQTYLDEQPSGELRREATGRLMEACQSAEDRGGARAAAAQYLQEFPNGPEAGVARKLITRR
jgi:hypothetical protein